jgi:hypothetical protein
MRQKFVDAFSNMVALGIVYSLYGVAVSWALKPWFSIEWARAAVLIATLGLLARESRTALIEPKKEEPKSDGPKQLLS